MDKYSYELKIQVVTAYMNKEGGCRKLAKRFNVHMNTVNVWCQNYKLFGDEIFKPDRKQKKWDNELKNKAINDYLSGGMSINDICKKYRISANNIFRKWLKRYNSHGSFKNNNKRSKNMAKKTTFEERMEIVKYCISNNKDYALTMDTYNVSYQQIYLWVRKYEQKGIDGLIDGRGKAKAESDLTEIDRLKAQNQILEAEKKRLEMEINVLKKLQEVERRRR